MLHIPTMTQLAWPGDHEMPVVGEIGIAQSDAASGMSIEILSETAFAPSPHIDTRRPFLAPAPGTGHSFDIANRVIWRVVAESGPFSTSQR